MSLDNVRQPQPVKVFCDGELEDVHAYIQKIKAWLEHSSYDHVNRTGPTSFTIYPRAIND